MKLRNYPELTWRSKTMRAMLDAMYRCKGKTARQIADEIGATQYHVNKTMITLVREGYVECVGLVKPDLQHCSSNPRLYGLTKKTLECQPAELPKAKPYERWVFKASPKDDQTRRQVVAQAKQYGPFGVLIAQAIGVSES